MEIKDLNVFFKTPGKQLNFVILLGIWAVLLFALSIKLPIEETAKFVLASITLFLTVYFFGYSLILTRRIVEKYYK
ncbi:MAG: hypothetical protein QMD14_02280 [Candidatus Aenigmarchaeota archaeon]|nr:hypothetical protein [Candidatus Aenigmarchaeota archaeon]